MARTKETWMDRARQFGDELRNAGHNAWMFGMGTLAVAGEETHGFYTRMVEKGEQFDVDIPAFSLDCPHTDRRVH